MSAKLLVKYSKQLAMNKRTYRIPSANFVNYKRICCRDIQMIIF